MIIITVQVIAEQFDLVTRWKRDVPALLTLLRIFHSHLLETQNPDITLPCHLMNHMTAQIFTLLWKPLLTPSLLQAVPGLPPAAEKSDWVKGTMAAFLAALLLLGSHSSEPGSSSERARTTLLLKVYLERLYLMSTGSTLGHLRISVCKMLLNSYDSHAATLVFSRSEITLSILSLGFSECYIIYTTNPEHKSSVSRTVSRLA